ncbi:MULTISPECIES: DUF423 domain-containing protein [unclassified Sphingomonas]|uniref:DUF423 domain-containing protein n=1 Tax=unclassified Sphingomonas TaxID=196159 RepID=UPI0006F3FA20|nr:MULTISPECIES: DUF423 domain-containing protein [unclassified Sphingomonas]KQM64726.1 hypothetical protein ASE65_15815 [Sphingomonas sp. Leaf16]KQN16859.1 hypothetical protein ASE81_15865 [Sphingomonas sp. Leaf29]KQN22840.1 hypothetical protein ASE83_15790 [Sphingomonas sp. Leaf32]
MNFLLLAAALSGAMAVAAGAFGAHGASGPAAEWLKTGGQYQLAHAIAALVAISLGARGPGWLFVGGGLLFGGSLYVMALGGPRGLLGPITPLGGLAMIVGWLWLGWIALRR